MLLDSNNMPPEPRQKVHKPQATHKPYNRAPKLPTNGQQLKTSAIAPQKHSRHNLTLNDWLVVVAYYDTHQPISQEEVIKHFATKEDGALIFAQSSLSRHLSESGCKEDKMRLDSNPTALSAKRTRVVTRPDVEMALVKWVRHMEERGEHVSGPMLIAKCKKFEGALDVPVEERLTSTGWVTNFCRT
jgi:Tc5 transposase DNA-binding domain